MNSMIVNVLAIFVPYGIYIGLYLLYRNKDYIMYRFFLFGMWVISQFDLSIWSNQDVQAQILENPTA